MANQQARQDKNKAHALIGHSKVGDDAETRQIIVIDGGIATADVEYDTLIDEASATVTYIGKCAAGSVATTDEAIWKIKKIDSTSGTKISFADGSTSFNKIWDDRATYTY